MTPEIIIVHCSDSEFGTQSMIDGWHRARGWNQCGYNAVIMNGYVTADHFKKRKAVKILDGGIEIGRALDADADMNSSEMSAHCYGYNNKSLTLCIIGVSRFTRNQIISAVKVVKWWQSVFSIETKNVLGHYEMPTANGKTCPNLDMNLFRALIEAKTRSMDLLSSIPNLKEVR